MPPPPPAPAQTQAPARLSPDPAINDALARGHAVVFLDVGMGHDAENMRHVGRIKLELYTDVCPRTCENFLQYCTGQATDPATRAPIGYKNCPFHRVLKDFMVQTGDFLHGDGTGSACVHGGATFADEPAGLALRHDRPGVLSMANSGPDTNGCQFFLTCKRAEWLDGKHVVFGRVLDDGGPAGGAASDGGMLTVRRIESAPTHGDGGGRPRVPIVITGCGEL